MSFSTGNGRALLDLQLGDQPALRSLLKASQYANDSSADRWEFAVSIEQLFGLGMTETDLRWLVRRKLVLHAQEVTLEGEDGRSFHPTGNLTFSTRTCFVLTDEGVEAKRSVPEEQYGVASVPSSVTLPTEDHLPERASPRWLADVRVLQWNGHTVKRFKWPAANQEVILNAFEEEGWPSRIDDPLSPQPEQDPKRRLSDTIKCLNRKQQASLIHFRGDGTGEGVLWEYAPEAHPSNGNHAT